MMRKSDFSFLFLLKLLFIPILYELVIGGSGHYLEVGPVTVRMLLYFFAILVSILYYSFKGVIKKDVIFIILALTFTSLFSSVVGYVNGASIGNILEDFKPLSFFYILLFFSLVIKNVEDIKEICLIIKRGSLVLGVVYIVVILLLLLGFLDFGTFYARQSEIGEVAFRNDTLFFYKGFIYLCVGFFFFLLSKGRFKNSALLFLFSCIVLTLTRGFILFTVLITIYYVFFINKNVLFKWIIFIIGIIGVLILIPMLLDTLGDKSDSDTVRYDQVDQVISAINPLSFIIGHGFGVGVPIRPDHMELSFLEVFHKQGIIGVCFWLGIFFYIFIMYYNIKNKKYKELALPFWLSVVFVILQSATNPYMNNPIGLTIILITIVVFSKLLELQKINS
jgi:hypothetical protein